MKLACFSDTHAVPMRNPRRPSPSTRLPALTSPGTGLTNTEPQFWPPGWCSRRQRTISAIAASAAARSPRRRRSRAASTTSSSVEVRAPEAQPEVAPTAAAPDRRPALVEVEDVDVDEAGRDVRAVPAGVHPHRPADRAGHADRPLEPGEPGRRRAPGEHRQGDAAAGVADDGAASPVGVAVADVDRRRRGRRR